jgi:hypothetical protein
MLTLNATPPIPLSYRGHLTASVTPAMTACMQYTQFGMVLETRTSAGDTKYQSVTAAANYSAPSTITTQNCSESLSYNAWVGVTQVTGLNGEQQFMSYDSQARPATATSAYGAVTTFGYPSTWVQTKTT